MEESSLPVWAQLRRLLEDGKPDALDAYLASLSGHEIVRAMFRLDESEQRLLLTSVSPAAAADIIEDIPDQVGADLLETIPAEEAASIVTELASDDRADLLSSLAEEDQDAILDEMEPESAVSTRELISYPPESAGGLMVTEYLKYPGRIRVREVLEDITTPSRDLSRYMLQNTFVVDRKGILLGTVRFRDLILAGSEQSLREVMRRPTVINADADLSTVNGCFEEVTDLSLPVTSDDGTLCGVLLRSRVDEALVAKAEGDHLKSQGIVSGEELRTMPVTQRSRRRLSWLSINILLNMIAASVIAMFEDTLTAVVALAVFLPIVSDMSGCSGNQAVAVSMRELTLGIVDVRDTLRVWWQEVKVGVINGLVLGLLLAVAAWAWRGNPVLGLIVGVALAVNTMVAVSIGGTVPLILKRLGADPAVASGPILTTVTDMCGFFLVLGIATLALPWL